MPEPSETLVGRSSERREIDARLRLATDGVGGLVLVSGEAGIGKTALAQHAIVDARKAGLDTAWAGCWQTAAVAPLLPWTQVIAQLTVDNAGGPDLAVDLADADLARLEQARRVERWLRTRASSPLVVVLEDLHWADFATLSVLEHLTSVLAAMPVLVIGTHRPPAVAADAFQAKHRDLHQRGLNIELTGLQVPEIGDLITSITGHPTGEEAAMAIAKLTGGNPLYTRELGRALGSEVFGRGSLDATDVVLPESLQSVIGDRVSATSPECQAMLQMLSVAGDEVPIDLLVAACDIDLETVLDVVDEAVAGRLAVTDVGTTTFRHALFRAVVYESLSSAWRASLHDRVGQELLARRERGLDVDSAALAHHFGAAATLGNAGLAFTFAMDSAKEASRMLAFDLAVRRYQDALAMLALDPTLGDRSEVMLALADAQVASGQAEDARTTFRRVAENASSDPKALGRAALGFSGGIGGFAVRVGDPDVCTLLQRADDALADDDNLGSLVLARLSIALTYRAPIAVRAEMVSTARARASATGDPSTIAEVLAAWCDVMAGPDDVSERQQLAQEIVERAGSVGDLGTVALGQRLMVEALAEAGQLEDFARAVDRFSDTTGRLGRSEYRWYAPLWRGALAMARAQPAAWLRARGELETLVDAGGANASLLAGVQLASMGFDLADPAFGQVLFDEILDPRAVMDDTQMLITLALLRALSGELDQAESSLDLCVDGALMVEHDSEWPAMMLQLTELIHLLGGHHRTNELTAAIAPYGSVWAVEGIAAGIRGPLSRGLGLLAATRGEMADADAEFQAAHASARAAGADLIAAVVDHDAGLLFGDSVRLRRAEDTWSRLGAAVRLEQLGDFRAPSRIPQLATTENRFVGNGEVWTIAFEGAKFTLSDRKGLRDLARLLASPGHEIAALDLVSPGPTVVQAPAGEVIDAQAGDAYRARLAEIDGELERADESGDRARSDSLSEERDALLRQLGEAFGLGGRPRSTGASSERARTAVRSRIRDAMKRIEDVHPSLGRHLVRSVKTGTFCVYDPDTPRAWEVIEPPHTV